MPTLSKLLQPIVDTCPAELSAALRQLAAAVDTVTTTGDLSRRVPSGQSDEVARLGASFNGMLAALDAPPGRFHPDQLDLFVLQERREHPDRVRAASDAGDHHVR